MFTVATCLSNHYCKQVEICGITIFRASEFSQTQPVDNWLLCLCNKIWCTLAYMKHITVDLVCIVFKHKYWILSKHLCTEGIQWKVKWMVWCFTVAGVWSPVGDAGDSADASIHDVLFKWRWKWWRHQSIQVWQVSEFRASGIHCVVLSVLVLVEDTHWLAGVTDWSLGPSST